MSNITDLRETTNYNIYSFTDLLNNLPNSFDEDSPLNSILSSISTKFDDMFYNQVTDLQFSKNPYFLDRSSLILLARDLGFNWSKIELIPSNKLPHIIEYLPNFYNNCKIGSICMVTEATTTNLDSGQIDSYALGELAIGNDSTGLPIYLQTDTNNYIEVTGVSEYNSINDSGIINNKLSNLISYITGNIVVLEPLWTNDFQNFYTIEEAGNLLPIPKPRLDWIDTIYSSSQVTVTEPTNIGGTWYFTPFVRVNLDQLLNGFSILDTLDLIYYFCPATLIIQETITESIGQFQFQTYCVSSDEITYSGYYVQPGTSAWKLQDQAYSILGHTTYLTQGT